MKYTIILVSLMAIYFAGRFISAAIEHGLPESPVYYAASISGVIVAYITYRLTKKHADKRRYALIPLAVLVISMVLNIPGIQVLKTISSGLFFWFIVSSLGFYLYFIIKRLKLKKQLTEREQTTESLTKAFVFIFIIFAALFIPVFAIVFAIALAK